MLQLKEGPNQPGPIFSTLFIYFIQFLLLINFSLRDPNYRCPRIFLFSRPHFATPICDRILRLPFATPFCDSHSRLIFATHISQLMFATPLATPIHNSHLRLHLTLMFATPDRAPNRESLFFHNFLSCTSTTDGRTVLTPQHHLPSVPTLTLLKN